MLSRRRFVAVAGVASSWGLGALTGVTRLDAAAGPGKIAPADLQWLLQRLPPEDQRFDPFAKLLVSPASAHATSQPTRRSGSVHAVRDAAAYAAVQFDTGVPWRIERALEILRLLVTLQDRDPASASYGLWPWCVEEPPAPVPPEDLAGAELCAALLLTTWITHRAELGRALADSMRESITHAARAIQRRPENLAGTTGTTSTTSTIVAIGIALGAAQEFKLADLRSWAKTRLRALYDRVWRERLLLDHNSPADTLLALQELSRMKWLVKDGRDQTLIAAVHQLAWQQVAAHFHPPTQQWAGPHHRSRHTDLRREPALQAFLQTATDGKLRFDLPQPLPLSLETWRLPLSCPHQWIRRFTHLEAPTQIVEHSTLPASSPSGSLNPLVTTTWLHPRFTLGSVNRDDLGSDRRPLLAYWGQPGATRCLRLRCLRNQADFPSALLFTVQHEGALLAAIVFATDDAGATAGVRDLRVRFELEGELGGVTVKTVRDPDLQLVLQDETTRFVIHPLAGALGKELFLWDQPELKLADRIDAIAPIDETKAVDLSAMGDAFLCFTLEERSTEQEQKPASIPRVERAGGRLSVRWSVGGKTLDLSVPTQPGPAAQLNNLFRAQAGDEVTRL